MSKRKCRFCGTKVGGGEEALWGHIQLGHPGKFEEVRDLETPFMLETCYDEDKASLEKKIVLVTPTEAYGMLSDLGNGKPTQNGDRTSRYIGIAKGYGEKMGLTVKAAVIELKNGLPEAEWGYGLHIINDVDTTDCQLLETERLEAEELEALLETVLNDLEGGRM